MLRFLFKKYNVLKLILKKLRNVDELIYVIYMY